ncbi:MAG: aminoacetone oxidase family FAD-binding enzyme, partial [Alphaproteobacteria bacterium]|nr:aminoacetone oxidase family FAD-binding enzyme [Alphaproteobacteria bacterium]
ASPRFCVSARARFGPQDFIQVVERHGIAYHEKTLGQLFCDTSSQDIIRMLIAECEDAGVGFQLETQASDIKQAGEGFTLRARNEAGAATVTGASLVIASGGKSIPKMGATDFGYGIAEQFGLGVVAPRPGLVPFVFSDAFRARYADLSGLSVPVTVRCGGAGFTEALLFTHRGLSGPAILQVSSYWRKGDAVSINLSPDTDIFTALKSVKAHQPKQSVPNALAEMLPRRLALLLAGGADADGRLADTPDKTLRTLADTVHDWRITPADTEGYRTAEVTVGGVDTSALSSKTMECRDVPGLYFIGEVVDVTGHLGGFNFQWAWASGHAAGHAA